MKNLLIVATSALCVLLAVAVPLPEQDVQLVQIPLEGNKELDILSLPENSQGELTERNKRTIGVLRQLFPELSKMTNQDGNGDVDLVALSERLESFNRVVRNTAAQAKEQPAAESKSDKVDATDANTIATAANKEDNTVAGSDNTDSKAPGIDELTLDDEPANDEDRNKRFLSFGFGGSGSNGSGGSGNFLFDIIRRTADRAARAAGTIYRVAAGTESFDLDINKQATSSTDDDTDFDHNNDDNDSTSRKLSAGNDNGLVGGSAGTEQTDERENAPEGEATVAKSADGYTEGIPGPVTRLFVLANRGLANLIQDLILRIAQTSERVVNFKARLITSLI
ncbi:uncharacterized protein LOC129566238 isoform X2 [Sitodiplosis mosellana]|uniref:uncharacterized protein LOC129566238 isoform X2 n=1 Tax=Sitodiplosis mosellana TaxID=263140 RepID=UPI002444A937|nr:uncharacterized protein LOC129566238 isoform X2 [Sitodiplosis mosellana]